ncbi:MAG: sulfatase-like hydrolase/transferase [Mariniblastus sp.]|nr:sulfatase-like hydrolase/transferase [Mariniblastus sp.]
MNPVPSICCLIKIGLMVLGCIAACEPNAITAQENLDRQAEKASSGSAVGESDGRPNIILINLDDADVDIFSDELLDKYLPNIKTLATNGIQFTNCHVTTPLCGPSRACLLSGQHAHRTGVKTNLATGVLNRGFTGGYEVFKQNGYDLKNIGVWMQRGGYRTMVIGKYHHGPMNPFVLPGWDDVFITFGGSYYNTWRYSNRLPLSERAGFTGEDVYRSTVEADEAVEMIESQYERNVDSKANQPFFLYLAPLAPHLPARKGKMLQAEYENAGKEIRIPSTPDFNEKDVSDKPAFMQYGRLSDVEIEELNNKFRERVMSTKSTDDMVGRIAEVLDRLKLRKNTYIFFTSDHGYQLGHNRMIAKKMPFHRNTIVPMFVTGPHLKPGESEHLLAHIDLVPTFLGIANIEPPAELDGKSWLPILTNPAQVAKDEFRSSLLIQNWESKSQVGKLIPGCYASLRTIDDQIFTEWSSGEYEYYDLRDDPYQLENKINSLSVNQKQTFIRQLHDAKQGAEEPLVTIGNSGSIGRDSLIQGVVEDDQSVGRVDLEIYDLERELYWSGQSWQAEKVTVPAELANAKGLVSDWSYPIDLPGIKHGGSIRVTALGQDSDGRISKTVQGVLKLEWTPPETVLIKPIEGAELESPIIIRGEGSDNEKLAGVELTLHRIDDNTFWDGGSWSKTKSTFFKRATRKLWHIAVEVPPGRYQLWARVLDTAGNYDPTPSQSKFSVK